MVVSNLSAGGVEEESKSSQQQQPCLLITDRRGNRRIQTNMFNDKPQLLYDVGGEIPEFLGRKIGCSLGEWVLLTGSTTDNDVLVNLLSKEVIELPLFGMKYDFCALTSHPYDPNCHIVYFDDSRLIFCQPGDKKITFKNWDYEFFPTSVCAGKLILMIDSSLAVIEFKESTYSFEVVEMDDSEIRVAGCSKHVYCECSGELFSIYQTNWGVYFTGFEIFKADLLNKKWVSVKNLGRVAIFIDPWKDYETAHVVECASVESGIKANSIYFLEPDDLDNYYIYNLEEGTIRLNPAFSSLEMETTKDTQLCWVMIPGQASFPRLVKGDQESICQDLEQEKEASVEVEEVCVQDSWNMVPPELLNLIQLHLFGRDHAVFRVVCKAWHQVSIQDHSIPSIPALLSSTTLLELCQSSSPLLMFQEDLTISCDSVPIFRFFDPVHKKLYRTGIPELRETDIQCSKDGWLLVSRRSDESIFFFNPLTQEKIELPRMPLRHSFFPAESYSLSFSSLPTSSDCLVVGITHPTTFIYILKHGVETWRRKHVVETWRRLVIINPCREYARGPVLINGLLHLISENRDMLVFNLKDDVVEGPFPCSLSWPTKQDYFLEDYFLEIDGALAFVSVSHDGGEIRILKWNHLDKYWELMEGGDDFGGKEMFLSRRGSFLEKIDDVGGIGNAIFLPMVDDAKQGVFYSLATHKYHTLYSGYSSELSYNVDKFLNGIWLKPDRKIVGDSNLKWFM